MTLSCIAALGENRVIGRGNRLPWHLPHDLRRFKAITMGHPMIMGRKTFDSIGRPLPGRRSIVLSRNPGWAAPGVETAPSLDAALERCTAEEEVFVIGGESLFRESLQRCDRLYLTLVHSTIEGDRFFPEIDWNEWEQIEDERHESDESHEHAFSFRTYDRTRPASGGRAPSP